jgi:hypothetical protein
LSDTRAYVADGDLIVPWRIDDGLASHRGEIIELLTPEQITALPPGTVVISIFGEEKLVGTDHIDLDTRGGRTAWGVPDRRQREFTAS